MRNAVPRPASLSTWMLPPLCFTIPYTVDNPSPVPLPIGLVVKNGSKICTSVSASIPCPESVTFSMAYPPGASSRSRASSSPTSTLQVSILSLPPCGIPDQPEGRLSDHEDQLGATARARRFPAHRGQLGRQLLVLPAQQVRTARTVKTPD